MKIRTLLSLSHAIVIGIFILTFLSIFFTLTKPPGPPPGMRMSGRLSGILKTCKTPEELAKATRTIGHGNLSALDIYDGGWVAAPCEGSVPAADKEPAPQVAATSGAPPGTWVKEHHRGL